MKWLEPPRDGVEATLRDALDEAAQRTGDEIAHRRVWTRIAHPPALPSRTRLWAVRLTLGGVIAAGVTGALLVWPRAVDAPVTPPSATAPSPQPAVAVVRQPLLDGPTTIRSDARNRTYLRLWGGTEVDLEPSSAFSLDRHNRPSIDKGRVSLTVPRQKPGHRFSLTAGPYLISVLGTKFQVRVAGDSVGVDVEEGVVEVSRGSRVVRVEAGEAWTNRPGSEAPPPPVRSRKVVRAPEKVATVVETAPPPAPELAPAPAPAPAVALSPAAAPSAAAAEQFRQAQVALASGQNQRALELLEALARGHGPTAENAAYEVGRVLRHNFSRPRQALSAWYRYRARFPQGMLRAETDLSIVDALLVVGDRTGALAEADAFLARHPESERRGEVARIAQQLRGEPNSSQRRDPAVPARL